MPTREDNVASARKELSDVRAQQVELAKRRKDLEDYLTQHNREETDAAIIANLPDSVKAKLKPEFQPRAEGKSSPPATKEKTDGPPETSRQPRSQSSDNR